MFHDARVRMHPLFSEIYRQNASPNHPPRSAPLAVMYPDNPFLVVSTGFELVVVF
jgi:hypothetical protein